MRRTVYFITLLLIVLFVIIDVITPLSMFHRFLFPLLLCAFLCLVRIVMEVTAPERTVSIDVLGIVILGVCGILAVFTGKSFYMDIALAWALQSFIGILALAKYLEGRKMDD